MVDVKKSGYTLSIYEDGAGAPWTWEEIGEHLGHVLTWSRRRNTTSSASRAVLVWFASSAKMASFNGGSAK